jgi:hypothetical protein
MSADGIPIFDTAASYEEDEGYAGNGHGIYTGPPESDGENWEVIFGAADYTTLVKPKSTATSREYRDKTYSMLKSLTIAFIKSGNMPDAAACIQHGPGFGVAMGQLADQDERAKRMLDFLTSPSNPYVNALLIGTSLISQLVRNHEIALQALPNNIKMSRRQRKAMRQARAEVPPRFTMHLFGREIPIRWNPRVKIGALFAGFRSQTAPPEDLTEHIFSDPKLLKALADQGIIVLKTNNNAKM